MSTQVHPSATVHPKAQLAEDVEIGPGAVVEAGVSIGRGTRVMAHAFLTGLTRIGERCEVHPGVAIGGAPQDLDYRGAPTEVRIGDRNVLREHVTIHRGSKEGSATVLGDDNYLMVGCHVGHDCRIGNRVILVNNVLLAGHVEVHDRAILSGGTTVHQFVRIGRLAFLQGMAGAAQDVPPFALAASGVNRLAGLNVVGMRRAGFSADARRAVQEAYRTLFRSGLPMSEAVARLEAAAPVPEVRELLDFIKSSKRGVCRFRARDEAPDDVH